MNRPLRIHSFLFIILLLSYGKCVGQNSKIDSLLALIKTDAADTNRATHLSRVSWEYMLVGEYDKGLSFGKQALVLAQNLDFQRDVADSYNIIGNGYYFQGNYPESLKNYFAALKIYEELKNKKSIANSFQHIGNVYMNQGNYSEALKNYFISLKIKEEIGDKHGIASSYNSIGLIYENQSNYTEALKNYSASLKLFEEIKDKGGIAYSYQGIGAIYQNQGNYTEALKLQFASLKIEEEIKDKYGIAYSYISLGQLYNKLNNTKEATNYLDKALLLSTENCNKDQIKATYESLAILDSTTGNYKVAFEHHKLYIIYRDSLNNEETKKKSLQSAMQYEYDKKEIAAKAEQDKLDAINTEEKKKQQIVIYAVAGLLVLVGVFAVFMFNRYRITNRQKVIIEKQKEHVDHAYEQLHEKNKEVMDSIRYAKRIQTALITSEKYIANSLNRLMKNN